MRFIILMSLVTVQIYSAAAFAIEAGCPGSANPDPNVILCDDFESGVLKEANGGLWMNDCGGQIVTDVKKGGVHGYRAPNDPFSPCAYQGNRMQNETQLYMRVYWYFPRNFDFVRMSGGGHAWRFWASLDESRPCPDCQIDTEVGGRADGVFDPSMCASDTYWGNNMRVMSFWNNANYNGGHIEDLYGGFSEFLIEYWNKLEFYIELNDVGQANGVVRMAINDFPAVDVNDAQIRSNSWGFNAFSLMTNYDKFGHGTTLSYGCLDRRHDWYYDDVYLSRAIPAGSVLTGSPGSQCSPGQTQSCYPGAAGTAGVGICSSGLQSCNNGFWSACDGAMVPKVEDCATAADDDCDGVVNDGCSVTPPPGQIGTVTDLDVVSSNASSATLQFTEVDDGSGSPVKYDVRYRLPPMFNNWGNATVVTLGTCASPVAGGTQGAQKTCTVDGLNVNTAYEFQLVAYTGTLNQNAQFGALSNIASGTTTSDNNPPPPPAGGDTDTPPPSGDSDNIISGNGTCEETAQGTHCVGTISGCATLPAPAAFAPGLFFLLRKRRRISV